MTAFDRIERRLPELIDELASAGIPDYFDKMLRVTAQSRQRPAWSALERWLPMGVIARPLPIRPMPWRLIAIVALIGLLAAATLVYVGSQRRVPPPFGPAGNGALIIGTADGDIVTVDPTTGRTTPLISGPTIDGGPFYSNDGQRFVFDRGVSGSDATTLFIANADGSGVRALFAAGTDVNWFDWMPNSDRVLMTTTIGGKGTISIVNVADRKTTQLPLDLDVTAASWRPNHDQIVVTARDGDNSTFWVVNSDGKGLRRIQVSEYAINEPTLSPDGTRLAYATWEPTSLPGRIRVVNIDTGSDHALTTDDGDGAVWQSPQFSPDGTKLLLNRFNAGSDPVTSQLAVMAVDGDGSASVMGPTTENPAANTFFSPDGNRILAEYPALKTTWMFDADGRNGHEAPFSAIGGAGASWQRRAP